jgi:branched-chain amino acid transport system substrate-binding protein
LAVVVAAMVLCTTTTTVAADKAPIKIGLLYSLSGMAAVVTEGTVYAHEIAAEEINARGGLLGGRKIAYVTRDDKLKPGEAVK